MPEPMIHLETRAGDPIKAGNTKVIPFSQALIVRLPGLNGGLIWNRPVSALFVSPEGQEQVVPIQDVTRQIQFAFLGVGLLGSFLMWIIFRTFLNHKE